MQIKLNEKTTEALKEARATLLNMKFGVPSDPPDKEYTLFIIPEEEKINVRRGSKEIIDPRVYELAHIGYKYITIVGTDDEPLKILPNHVEKMKVVT